MLGCWLGYWKWETAFGLVCGVFWGEGDQWYERVVFWK
jgi:hypothetical protein